jgi:hypothetical protein
MASPFAALIDPDSAKSTLTVVICDRPDAIPKPADEIGEITP